MAITADDIQVILKLKDELTPALGAAKASLKSAGESMTAAGMALLPLSAGIAAVGVGVAKTAIDFESSFSGVRKTVDATEDQFATLKQSFRDLSREIPVSTTEINRVAEAGGQLGVKTEDILGFTRVMVNMGVATNLSSDAAAEGLAQIANIMNNEAGPSYDRLGSTIVDLGNKSAATESQILDFGLRLAGAGKVAGMTEAQILGIGTALASVGINAEAGGTAFSKVIIDMASAVSQGGKSLDDFAQVAGMASADFAKKFKTDAAGALTVFVEGLGKVKKSGGDLFATLENLGITETRMRDALLRSAGAGDLLRKSIETGTKAWADNNALTAEAEKRYKTMASQLILLWNDIKDVALTLGDALLPTIRSVVATMRDWVPYIADAAKQFAALPSPVQLGVVALLALVAAAGPLLLALGSMATGISSLIGLLSLVTPAITVMATNLVLLKVAFVESAFGAYALGAAISAGVVAVAVLATIKVKELIDVMAAMHRESQQANVDGLENQRITMANLARIRERIAAEKGGVAAAAATSAAAKTVAISLGEEVAAKVKATAAAKALKDASELLGRKVTDVAEAHKALAIAASLSSKALKDAAELASKLSGDDAAKDIQALAAAWRTLTPAQQAEAQVIDRVVKAYAALRDQVGPGKLPKDLEDLFVAANKLDFGSLLAPPSGITRTAWVEQIKIIEGELKNGRHIGSSLLGPQAGVKSANVFMESFSSSLAKLPGVIQAAIQGGGNVGQAVGAQLGGDIGKHLGERLGKHLGGSVGKIFGPLGEVGGQLLGSLLGKGIGKLFGGLFGGGEEKKVNDLRDKFIEAAGGLDKLREHAHEAGLTLDRLLAAKKVNDFEAATEELNAAFQRQADIVKANEERIRGLEQAMESIGGAFGDGGIIALSAEDAAAQATIFTTVFNRAVKEKGLVGAADALRESFTGLWESLGELIPPEALDAILGPINRVMEMTKPGGEGDPAGLFRGAAEGAAALAQVLDGLSKDSMPLLDTQFAAFGQQAQSAFDQAIAGGATSQEAFMAIGPLLQSIISASEQYGLAIDENTQALIDQAEQNGVTFKTSPMERMVEVLEAIATKLGADLPRATQRAERSFDDFGDEATRATRAATRGTDLTVDAIDDVRPAAQRAGTALRDFGYTTTSTLDSVALKLDGVSDTMVNVWDESTGVMGERMSKVFDQVVVDAGDSMERVTDTWRAGTGTMENDTLVFSEFFAEELLETADNAATIFGYMSDDFRKSLEGWAGAASDTADQVNDALSGIHDVNVGIHFITDSLTDLNVTPAAHGFHGIVDRPRLFLAGESGRERVDVTPVGQSRSGGSDMGPLLAELREMKRLLRKQPASIRDAVLING